MKKIILAAFMAFGCAYGAHAQQPGVHYSNATPYTVNIEFFGDAGPTCTATSTTIPYLMSGSSVTVSAGSRTWIGATAYFINGARFTYMVSGVPISSVTFPACGVSSGSYVLSFPGGPSVNLSFNVDPTTYGFDIL